MIVGELLATALGIALTKLFLLLPHASPSLDLSPSSTIAHPPRGMTFEDLRFLAGALAVGLSSAAMTLTKTVYPPAGATALLSAIDPRCTNLGWWLLPLAMLSTIVNLVVGLAINNLQRRWPVWWWTEGDVGRRRTQAEGGGDISGPGGLPIVQGVEVVPQVVPSTELEKRVSEASTLTMLSSGGNKPVDAKGEKVNNSDCGDGGASAAGMQVRGDRLILPPGLDLSEQETQVLDEVRRRMRIMSRVEEENKEKEKEKEKVMGDENV